MTNIDEIALSSDEEGRSKNRALYVYRRESSTVELRVDSLSPRAYLKDDIIQFYLAYLLNEVCSQKDRKRIHIFDSIFCQQLDKAFAKDVIDVTKFRQLRKWYDRIDIFEKDFLVFPICKHDHWLVIVICYPGAVQALAHKKPNIVIEVDKHQPAVIVMDSLGLKATETTSKVRDFLDYEWRGQLRELKRFSHSDLKDYFPKLPKQRNTYDCGLYMLVYVRFFLEQPDTFHELVIKEDEESTSNLSRDIQKCLEVHTRESIKDLIKKECTINSS